MRSDTENLRMAMKIHQDLARAIAPATPGTIKASNLRQNRVLIRIGWVGLFALTMLVVMNAFAALGENSALADQAQILATLERLCGAILGATLFAFWTARNYLRDGTFRPQYYQLYVLRFVLGIFTGFILGELVGSTGGESEGAAQYGPLVIAVVGGFSAEAVVQMLQRIADILVAAIRGNEWDRAREDAQTETSRRLNEVAAELQEALTEADPATREETLRAVVARMWQT